MGRALAFALAFFALIVAGVDADNGVVQRSQSCADPGCEQCHGTNLDRCTKCLPGYEFLPSQGRKESGGNKGTCLNINGPLKNGAVYTLEADAKLLARCDTTTCPGGSIVPNQLSPVVNPATSPIPATARFAARVFPDGRVALRADNGLYIRYCWNCFPGGFTTEETTSLGEFRDPVSLFTPFQLDNGHIALRTANERLLSVCGWCIPANFASATYHVGVTAHAGVSCGSAAASCPVPPQFNVDWMSWRITRLE